MIFASLLFYAALAATFLFRLIPVWSTQIPGGLQDTRFLLWNDWWFTHAITHLQSNPYVTSFLYHPFGTSLVLNDSPLWNSLVTFAAQKAGSSLIASANWSFLLSWTLAGWATYLLTREVTSRKAPAVVAGLYVMTHSFTLICTMQNWTRFNLFGIPLFLWMLVRARRSGGWLAFALCGVALAWTAACQYYFFVYCLLICAVVAVADICPYGVRFSWAPAQKGWRKYFLFLSAIAGLLAVWIHMGHPSGITIGKSFISLKTPYNAVLVMWLGLYAWFFTGWRSELYKRDAHALQPAGTWAKYLVLLGIAFLCMLPLTVPLAKMAMSGDYPHQSLLWKTERAAANLFSFFMPNSMHFLWGESVTRWFTSRGMVVQEQAASIGWVTLALFYFTRPWKQGASPRRWALLALGAMGLALGTYLHLAQHNLWMPMPFYLVRLLPIIGKARLADHWMTVGSVATAVLLAISILQLCKTRQWQVKKVCAVVGLLILIENWPKIPVEPLPEILPPLDILRAAPPGAVLPIPLFVGDAIVGIGNSTPSTLYFPWDYLWYQIYHQKPMLGGYMGRMSPKIIQGYKADPFLKTLLDLEDYKIPDAKAMPQEAAKSRKTFDFQYVLVYEDSTTPEVLRFVMKSLPLEMMGGEGAVKLYRVRPEKQS